MAITLGTIDSTYIRDTASSDGTLEGLYQALYTYAGDAETYMTKIGSDPYTYGVVGNRCIRIYGNITIESMDTVEFNKSSNDTQTFRVEEGGALYIEEGVIIDGYEGAVTGGGRSTFIVNGIIEFQGTVTNPIKVYCCRYLNLFRYGTTNTDSELTYVEFHLPNYQWNPMFTVYPPRYGSALAHTFQNVSIYGQTSDQDPKYTYGLAICGNDNTNITLDNIHIENTYYGMYLYGGVFKMTNSTIKNTYGRTIDSYYGQGGTLDYIANDFSTLKDNHKDAYQPKMKFDTCTFDENYTSSTTRAFMSGNNVRAYLKNCTFKNAYYGCYASQGSITVLVGGYGGQTFTNNTYDIYSSEYDKGMYYGYELNLTVTDTQGNVIENAMVTVAQASNKEMSHFTTDSNGNIKDLYGDDPVFIERQVYGYSTLTYSMWSDDISSGRYHNITIMKDGYLPYNKKVEFTSNQTVIAVLHPIQGIRAIAQG